MSRFVCHNISGRIVLSLENMTDDQAGLNTPNDLFLQEIPHDANINPDEVYVFNSELTARPTPPVIVSSGISPLAIPIDVFEAGSTVAIWDQYETSLTITDLSESLTLTDPGQYRIVVSQPFPYRNVSQDIEVT